MRTLKALLTEFPRAGCVTWIGIRPARGADMQALASVELEAGHGLPGDRYNGRSGSRAVTLVQAEHLEVIASLLGGAAVAPAALRRNLVVRGINLLALKGQSIRVGAAMLEITGPCHPCSRMRTALGDGGYNAMRGHGGVTARVLHGGSVALGDTVVYVGPAAADQ